MKKLLLVLVLLLVGCEGERDIVLSTEEANEVESLTLTEKDITRYNNIMTDLGFDTNGFESNATNDVAYVNEMVIKHADEYVDFGVIVGTIHYILDNMNYSDDDIHNFVQDNPDVLDMLYPSYLPKYSSSEMIAGMNQLSKSFVDYVLKEEGVEFLGSLLRNDIELKRLDAMKLEWADTIGADGQLLRQNEMQFSTNPKEEELIWRTTHATWLLSKDFVDRYDDDKEQITWSKEYVSLMNKVNDFEASMTELDDHLRFEGVEYRDLTVEIENFAGINGSANSNWILMNNWTLLDLHYAGYLDQNNGIRTMSFLRYRPVVYTIDSEHWYDEILGLDLPEEDSGYYEYAVSLLSTLESLLEGKSYSEVSPEEFTHTFVYSQGDYSDYMGTFDTFQGMSFMFYLKEKYTDQEFLEICLNPTEIEVLTGDTWLTLAGEWEEYVYEFMNK